MAEETTILPSATLLTAFADRPCNEFVEQVKWFRLSLEHLAGGLDVEMAETEGGVELLAERIAALPDNVASAWAIAGEIAARRTDG